MGCSWYLAMTDQEVAQFANNTGIARLGCTFSPHHKALENLPHALSEDALLVIDDRHGIDQHDPQSVIRQLRGCQCAGILLDLQRPKTAASTAMVKAILNALPHVAVTEPYAHLTSGPVLVFYPPGIALEKCIAPWKGRTIWLDIPFGIQQGDQLLPLNREAYPYYDQFLLCAYKTSRTDKDLTFTFCRNRQMLPAILKKAQSLGVEKAIGLYQEYKK